MRPNEKSLMRNSWLWTGTIVLFVLTKGKQVLMLLKANQFATSVISMAASIGAYALLFPVGFAVGVVVMLLVHEAGHIWAARRKGLPVSAPLFIPFIGAMILMRKHPRDAETEAYIALAGPLIGTAGALAAFAGGVWLHSELLLVIAKVGFFLNLINLLPIHPLDGGRISAAISRWLWIPGLIGGLVVVIWIRSPLFFLIWLVCAWEMGRKHVWNEKDERHYAVTKIDLSLDELTLRGAFIPGENHRCELPFVTYSTRDGSQKIRVRWESLGMHEVIRMPEQTQGLIHCVKVAGIEQLPEQNPDRLRIHCEIEYEPHMLPEPGTSGSGSASQTITSGRTNADYFNVPALVRWKYGTLYAALSALLLALLYAVHELWI